MPPVASAANTKDRILDAGAEAIVAKSYNGCGLNEILCAAGVPKGSFYHYFKSKEDFGVALIERSVDEHSDRMKSILTDRSTSPLERLRTYYDAMRECFSCKGPARECLIGKLALEIGQLSEPMRAAIKCGYDQWSALLAKTLREAQAAGELDQDHDPDVLAGLLTNALEGVILRMQINRDLDPLDEFIDFVFGRLLTAPR